MSLNPTRLPEPLAHAADRYLPGGRPAVLTGVQAVVRMMTEQHRLDQERGCPTSTFVSGYPGSPLGGLDTTLASARSVLSQHGVTVLPGVNEELAATAVWGSQHVPSMRDDVGVGVVGFWYGKGPGLDRATDVLRHANLFGADSRGGMVLLVGDDPAPKSSSVPAASERSLAALNIPVLFPRNAEEIIRLGIHAVAMSRASGCVVALKLVADVADGLWTVRDPADSLTPGPLSIMWEEGPYVYRKRAMDVAPHVINAAEEELVGPRAGIVRAYARTHRLDVIEVDSTVARTGLVAAGQTYDQLRQALTDAGLDDDGLRRAGIRVLRLGMIHPVEPRTIRGFAEGLSTVLVMEEKASFLESQIKDILYGSGSVPLVLGKHDGAGHVLVPAHGSLTADRIRSALTRVLGADVVPEPERRRIVQLPLVDVARTPYFCSGCPHNRSTVVPEGSLAGGGIGCHTLVTLSARKDTAVTGLTQMGGEGAQWLGQHHYSDVPHIFQNLGDGTFSHSGQLAVQACVAAGATITFKILFNRVVAMTGAQQAEGGLSVAALTHKLRAEGVGRIIVCAENPAEHHARSMAKGTQVWSRDRLDEAQQALRKLPGVTVLIYDQHCAADARRQRKRGTLAPRDRRVMINEAVCEGCGDCGAKSNCLSVQPVETEFGRKTRIEQTSCNTDYSCLEGDCPAFVTVDVGAGQRRTSRRSMPGRADQRSAPRQPFPEPPPLPELDGAPEGVDRRVFLSGIGGTGIVTVNQVLATAAAGCGYAVTGLDQTGLSQKAGPVAGHLRYSAGQPETSNRLSARAADCILAFDLLTATTPDSLAYGDPDRTVVVASSGRTPTGAMVHDPAVQHPDTADLVERLGSVSRRVHVIDALGAADTLFGSVATANFLLVGAALQLGCLALPTAAVEEAITINGVAVEENLAAVRWGRVSVADPDAFARATRTPAVERGAKKRLTSLEASPMTGETLRLVELRAQQLVGYQGRGTAERYVRHVERVWRAERQVTPATELSEGVAVNLYKLTAYKDEYEVARLLTAPDCQPDGGPMLRDGRRMTFHLHPPVLRALGLRKKLRFGPGTHWVLRALARMRFLRGTPLDPFGMAGMRRVERRLLADYRSRVDRIIATLDASTYAVAVELASLPEMIRGYEGVKETSIETYRAELQRLEQAG